MTSLDPVNADAPASVRVSVERHGPWAKKLPKTNVAHVARVVEHGPQASAAFGLDLEQITARIGEIQSSRSVHRAVKRAFDIIGATLALVLFLPLMLVVAVAVRLSSPGPVIFRQLRHGQDGRPFEIYKFRTFRADATDPTGRLQTVRGDPRVTSIGRILRRRNLDELPQLWNVIKGDMSLVGPRPHPIGMLACGKSYEEFVGAYTLRHAVRPGVTGLAQAKGFRGETREPVAARMRIVCDLYYVANFSLLLDLKILALTCLREFRSGTGV